ncbi:cell division cycle 48C [Tanacetum coccineum]
MRHKTEKLTRMIRKAFASKGKTEPFCSFDVNDDVETDEDPAMLVKKMFESNHLKRRRVKLDDEDEEPKIDLMKEMLRISYSKPKNNLMKEGNLDTPVKSVKPSPKKLKSFVNDGGVDGNVKGNEVVPRFKDLGGMGDEDEEPLIKEILRIRYSKPKTNLTKESNIGTPDKRLKPSPKKPKSLVNDGGVDGNVKENEDGTRFKDLGGMDDVLEELIREVIVPLYYLELPRGLGLRPITGILLHGPPGCGKTDLAKAIANETGLAFYMVFATELVSGITGASEENIRQLFTKAYRTAPSIVFIDEIDAIASKRENLQREMERRIVTQLMTCMDESHMVGKPDDPKNTDSTDAKPGYVLVIGATNRPDTLDQALRRPGRFDREITLGVPNEKARIKILTVLTRNLKLEGAFNLVKIVRSTPGFVEADLEALVKKASNLVMNRIIDGRKVEVSIENADTEENKDWWKKLAWSPEDMEKLSIAMSDF